MVVRWGHGISVTSDLSEAARNPQDLLIVEGYPTVDPRFAGITVLATQATTKQLQQAERQRRAAPAG